MIHVIGDKCHSQIPILSLKIFPVCICCKKLTERRPAVQLKNFEVIGIYNADAGLRGELKYLTRKAVKNETCDLCDLTHGWNPFGKRKWKKALAKSGIGITFLHRNQASNNHKKASGLLPAIISNITGEWECLVSNAALKQ